MAKPLRKNDIKTLGELEYILKRPHIFIGSIKEEVVDMYMYDEDDKMVKRKVPFIPGMQKVIEEAVDNSIDEAIRTDFEYGNLIEVWYKDGVVRIRDNGRGLPIEKNDEGEWVPETIYTKLRTGSNFDDEVRLEEEMKGMNGVGVSLTNIFSEWLEVKSANGAKMYQQKFKASGQFKDKPKVGKSGRNFTELEFKLNFNYFQPSEELEAIMPELIVRYLKNSAFCYPEITFKFNGQKINAKNLKSFMVKLHEVSEFTENAKVRIGIFCSEDGFQHLSFVNGLETRRGGTHVDHISYQIQSHIREYIQKKFKLEVKPADIKNKLFLMISCRIKGPDFDTQTKERLITPLSEYNDIFNGENGKLWTPKFLKSLIRNEEIIDPIVETYKIKQQVNENLELKKLDKQKVAKKIRVDKYLPATKNPTYLCLTEGDSAKAGLSAALGRDIFSYFPLRGKMLNAFEAPVKKITSNEEIKNIIQILQLNLTKSAQDDLRYEKVLIATDQDADGLHIRALALGFFFRFAPSLIEQKRICFLQTPVAVIRKKGKIVKYFFNLDEYSEYARQGLKGETVEYMKGLGSWIPEELEEIVRRDGVDNFIIPLYYKTIKDAEDSLKTWLGGKEADSRKEKLRGKTFNINEA